MLERNRIAETLRDAREKQGLSLEEAAAAAGIPLQYLRLLEGEANVRGISDELYLIPFFRKYALFFGIDAEELLPEFLGTVGQLPGEGSRPIRLTYRHRWAFLWRPTAVLLTIGVAVSLMLRREPTPSTFEDHSAGSPREEGTLGASDSTAPDPASGISPTAGATDATAVPGFVDGTPTNSGSVAVTPATPDSTPIPEVAPSGAHELKIAAIEETWLSLAAGDQPAKQYLLRVGESRSWSANRFSLTVGNAGGIMLWVDGRELPAIGRPGQVVRNLQLPDPASWPSPIATRTGQ